jgi:hypothetical protein
VRIPVFDKVTVEMMEPLFWIVKELKSREKFRFFFCAFLPIDKSPIVWYN